MKSALLLVISIGSIIIGGLMIGDHLTSFHEDSGRERVQYVPLPTPLPGGASPGDGGEGFTSREGRSAQQDRNLCRITARFVDKLGSPIPGTRTELSHDREAYIVSNEHGRIDWSVPDDRSLASKTRPMNLHAFCNGFSAREVVVEFVPGTTVELGDLELKPGGAIAGRVVDTEGNPIVGARVLCSRPALPHDSEAKNMLWGPSEVLLETRTGEDGGFRIEGAPTGFCRVWAKTLGSSYRYTRTVDVERNHLARGIKLVLDPSAPR